MVAAVGVSTGVGTWSTNTVTADAPAHPPPEAVVMYVVVVAGCAYTVLTLVPVYGVVAPASVNKPMLGDHIAAGGVNVIVIDQLVNVGISPLAASRMANVQFPPVTEYRDAHVVTFDRLAVGPTPFTASAANVPVNGAVPVESDVDEAELIVVFVKLSPPPPRWFTRFRILPFGALRLTIRSPSKVVSKLKLTEIAVMVEPGGIVVTGIE
jgi:hypothetical protein